MIERPINLADTGVDRCHARAQVLFGQNVATRRVLGSCGNEELVLAFPLGYEVLSLADEPRESVVSLC
jgi:hypothetical protein